MADVPDTVLRARGYSIRASGLQESRQYHAYPAPLYGLLDRLTAVRDQVVKDGVRYRGDGVRLVVVRADGTAGAAPWPAGVPVPRLGADRVDAVTDLRGDAGRTVARVIPRRNAWDWQVYRTRDGRILRAAWRYLLPHEL